MCVSESPCMAYQQEQLLWSIYRNTCSLLMTLYPVKVWLVQNERGRGVIHTVEPQQYFIIFNVFMCLQICVHCFYATCLQTNQTVLNQVKFLSLRMYLLCKPASQVLSVYFCLISARYIVYINSFTNDHLKLNTDCDMYFLFLRVA